MNAVLVSTYAQPVALGMRYISAFLKRHGHQVKCLFVGTGQDWTETLPAKLRDDFIDHCRGADLVGLSLMTNSFYLACELTRLLRAAKIKAPILWGGTHPTVAPRESAEMANHVCIGEGEKALLEFIEAMDTGRDPGTTRGFAHMANGRLVRNPVYPLADDLDTYPFPDYETDGHWVAHKGRLVPARPELMRGTLRRYRMSSTRGCPFSCSFCNNATQMRIYQEAGYGSLWVRKRSAESILAEIEQVRRRHPGIEAVNLIDDLFLVRSEEEVARFAEAYVQRVNLPLEIDAFPNTVTEPKIEALAKLPLELISMGIQSGCPETLREIYNRPTRTETVARAIRIIADHGLRAEYHYLVSNPFESDASRIATLRFVASHHRGPAKIRVFPLQFYPGSVLYERARAERIIEDRPEAAYRGVYRGKKFIAQALYLEIWLRIVLALRGAGVPIKLTHRVVDLATHPWVRTCLDRRWFPPAAFGVYRIGRVLYKNLLYKPILKPLAKLRTRKQRRARKAVPASTGPVPQAA